MKLGVTENAHLLGSRDHAPRVNFAPSRVSRIVLGATPESLLATAATPARLALVTVPLLGDPSPWLASRVDALTRHLTSDASLFVRVSPRNAAATQAVLDAAYGSEAFQSEIVLVGDGARPDPLDRRWSTHHDVLFVYAREGGTHHFDASEARRSGATGSVWSVDPYALYTRLLRVHTALGDVALDLTGDLRFAEAAVALDRGFVLVVATPDEAFRAEATLHALAPECVHFAPSKNEPTDVAQTTQRSDDLAPNTATPADEPAVTLRSPKVTRVPGGSGSPSLATPLPENLLPAATEVFAVDLPEALRPEARDRKSPASPRPRSEDPKPRREPASGQAPPTTKRPSGRASASKAAPEKPRRRER